jgi:hypothetical protein
MHSMWAIWPTNGGGPLRGVAHYRGSASFGQSRTMVLSSLKVSSTVAYFSFVSVLCQTFVRISALQNLSKRHGYLKLIQQKQYHFIKILIGHFDSLITCESRTHAMRLQGQSLDPVVGRARERTVVP